ncbi:methyl-accepting chemotaxis protein [Sapientia aquatica]|uniref:Methyl-accepting transducer domain-containing protein n=1 Tax=Sapientia aquatica TaxID=1549640 RepID=A0A4R5VN34_9BURK|nr:methyl-accepting chemotaxis protein [Sapientia aquatica]TDK59647.1 hypothetical protein E2I14_18540 [Sapientia aquatica]
MIEAIPESLPAQPINATDPSDELAFYTQIITSQLDLLQAIARDFGLVRDPDIAVNKLALISLQHIPLILDITSYALADSKHIFSKREINPQQVRLISDRLPMTEYLEAQVQENALAASKSNESVKTLLDKELPTTSEFRGLARHYFLMGDVNGNQDRFSQTSEKTFTNYLELQRSTLDKIGEILNQNSNTYLFQRNIVIALTIICLTLAAYLFTAFYSVTKSGLALISSHLHQLSQGDLRFFPEKPKGRDEAAMVLLDLRAAYESLHALIIKVRNEAASLRMTSAYISTRSIEISDRSSHTSQILESQLSTTKTISSNVAQSAQRTESVANFSYENASVAAQGGKVIDEVVETMEGIHSSSKKIGDIIGVIDSIAFQTNILALNASVEAARAGDSGRGFSVVASEVRNLARRSSDAASEIKKLISSSVSQVNEGSKTVTRAGDRMKAMVENANTINQFLEEISESAVSESRELESVSISIDVLNEETQSNLTMIQETKVAADSLLSQADMLEKAISNFRVQ